MNIKQIKENAQIIQAIINGQSIEFTAGKPGGSGRKWIISDTDNLDDFLLSEFVLKVVGVPLKEDFNYRPWRRNEVPIGALLKNDRGLHSMILWANDSQFGWVDGDDGILSDIHLSDALTWKANLIHSVDGGKTWSKCGVQIQ